MIANETTVTQETKMTQTLTTIGHRPLTLYKKKKKNLKIVVFLVLILIKPYLYLFILNQISTYECVPESIFHRLPMTS